MIPVQDKSAPTRFRLGHRPELDGLRGVFILLVLTAHGGIPFMQGGGLGVDGFFVLSGFLITCLLLQEWQQHGSISLRRFYIRRALRLLPALYALLVMVGLFTLIYIRGEGAVATGRGILLSFLYSTNLAPLFFSDYQIGLGLMSHAWSLALEEQFYFVWPLLLIALLSLRQAKVQLLVWTGVLVAAVLLLRGWLVISGAPGAREYLGINIRAEVLLIGCALGVLAAGGMILPSIRAARLTRCLAMVGIGVLTYLVVDPTWLTTLSAYYLAPLLSGLCWAATLGHLVVSPHGRLARLLSWRPLVQVGIVSYGIYLWHNPIFHLAHTGQAGWLDLPVQLARLAVTAALVVLSYRYLERPMLRIKDRFSGRAPSERNASAPGVASRSENILASP
jgi:peptidoglycan/LPS O-acetylase OafA/YrhL